MTLQRKARIRPVNAKRRKKNFQRAYGGEDRVLFVKSLPCVVPNRGGWHHSGPIDVTHIQGGGVSREQAYDQEPELQEGVVIVRLIEQRRAKDEQENQPTRS